MPPSISTRPCRPTLRENAAPELYRGDRLIFVSCPQGPELLAFLHNRGIAAKPAEMSPSHAHLIALERDADLDAAEAVVQEWAE